MLGACGKIRALTTLGLRLVVGQQTLDLYAEVRLLQPQPKTLFAHVIETEAYVMKLIHGIHLRLAFVDRVVLDESQRQAGETAKVRGDNTHGLTQVNLPVRAHRH